MMASLAVPPELTTVLITAADAPAAEAGFVSPVTMHSTAAPFKAVAVPSVIWRRPAEKAVLVTGASLPPFLQVAAGFAPVNDGKPVTEIKATAVESTPVKLTVKVAATDFTLMLNAVEAV